MAKLIRGCTVFLLFLLFAVVQGWIMLAPQTAFGSLFDDSPSPSPQISRVRISQKVSQLLVIRKVQPTYPSEARRQRIEGMVVLKAEVSKEGDVTDLTLISGPAILASAAIEAVKQWKYKPYVLNGQEVAVETQVSVAFELKRR